MQVEGIGKVPPAPVQVRTALNRLRWLRDEADKRNAYRGYTRRTDAWGRGFIRNPALVGLMGEHCSCEYLTRRGFPCFVDIVLRPYGDDGRDLEVCGLVLQVKTRRKGIARRSLVKRGDGRGRIVPLACDVFVFAQWDETAPDDVPQLLGWIWARDARSYGVFERSPVSYADHWNLRIPDALLLPMSRLVDELASRRARR
jgi:hypothetical protein